MPTPIDGDNVLYHYFQSELVAKDRPENHAIITRMILDLSIWFPPVVYQKIPVLLPFVVRDPTCRRAVNKEKEEWGSCDEQGYFRDDNTLIKAIPRKFRIISPRKEYAYKRLGNGFVASHVWRETANRHSLASRDPLLNSFIPNLVWLPRQLSKLTDREGSFAQRYLQKLSLTIYRDVLLSGSLSAYVRPVWEKLPTPSRIEMVETGRNYFDIREDDVNKFISKLKEQVNILQSQDVGQKIYCSRYLKSFELLSPETKINFLSNLEIYLKTLA